MHIFRKGCLCPGMSNWYLNVLLLLSPRISKFYSRDDALGERKRKHFVRTEKLFNTYFQGLGKLGTLVHQLLLKPTFVMLFVHCKSYRYQYWCTYMLLSKGLSKVCTKSNFCKCNIQCMCILLLKVKISPLNLDQTRSNSIVEDIEV